MQTTLISWDAFNFGLYELNLAEYATTMTMNHMHDLKIKYPSCACKPVQ